MSGNLFRHRRFWIACTCVLLILSLVLGCLLIRRNTQKLALQEQFVADLQSQVNGLAYAAELRCEQEDYAGRDIVFLHRLHENIESLRILLSNGFRYLDFRGGRLEYFLEQKAIALGNLCTELYENPEPGVMDSLKALLLEIKTAAQLLAEPMNGEDGQSLGLKDIEKAFSDIYDSHPELFSQ